eukprot:Hpha_TRINITY_DN13414_c0_g1::TRINITY_DN13414_c0_g1_i1::g.131264::m.131264/K05601/hcp; hydroxylamine reductase
MKAAEPLQPHEPLQPREPLQPQEPHQPHEPTGPPPVRGRRVVRTSDIDPDNQELLVLYGSQTGTAESYATMLGTYSKSHGLHPRVLSLNDAVSALVQPSFKTPKAVAIVCSTYGTGQFPKNAQRFYGELLKGAAVAERMKGVPFAVLGLGNSNNERYNTAAKMLDEALRNAGAKSLLRLQLSCEMAETGHEGVFRAWKKDLWARLGTAGRAVVLSRVYKIDEVVEGTSDRNLAREDYIEAEVVENRRYTPDGYVPRSNIFKFSVATSVQQQKLGRLATMEDHVMIQPYNNDETVDRALKRLKLDGDKVVRVTPLADAASSFFDGRTTTVRALLRGVVDLGAIPTRSLLEIFATQAVDKAERQELDELANDLRTASEYNRLTSGVFSIIDALERSPSLDITLETLLTYAPHITPRTYSLSMDNTDGRSPELFEFAYAVPQRQGDGGNIHIGLCGGYLETLIPSPAVSRDRPTTLSPFSPRAAGGHRVMVRFEPSGIELPKNKENLCIVALGTGIGSARAVLHHRHAAKLREEEVGKAVLYYGFRHSFCDNLYGQDLDALEKEGLVEIRRVASHDSETFRTPMDVMDPSVADFIGKKGEVFYCGLGGSIPLAVENALRRNRVDVAALRREGRYHEEYYTPDRDMENLLKNQTANSVAATLPERLGTVDMFCQQCEQTFRGRGCTTVGVCGKTATVSAMQDLTIHMVKHLGFYAHHLRALNGTSINAVNRTTLHAMFSTLTNVNFDENRFAVIIKKLQPLIADIKAQYEAVCPEPKRPAIASLPHPFPATIPKLVELGRQFTVLTRYNDPETQSAAGVTEMLMYGLKGIAAYTDHSLMYQNESNEIYAFIHKALAFLASENNLELGDGLALCLEAGKINVASMAMLYDSNKALGVPSPHSVNNSPTPGKCILVSGHDLLILKKLLEATEPLGINVYTHGELLPAHGYPELRKHTNLVGNFGGAWQRQSIEFPHFPGPILLTTNCLTEPHDSYKYSIFTAGATGWKGVPHIGNTLVDIDFRPIIAAAKASEGFLEEETSYTYSDPVGQKRVATYFVGFGHETILSVAPTIVEQIQKGNITRFFVIGGCDGFEGQRSYYTDLAEKLPKTAVILTLGCGKYRVNHLALGTIGDTGLPRVLDMGQCNDSFGAVQVALALAGVLKCEVSNLPLSIVLSWFEQKAVAVLLSLLHLGLKPIHIGPSLPAFITPQVLDVLVKEHGLVPCGDAAEDARTMCAAAKMS